jgi:hypothetical protein
MNFEQFDDDEVKIAKADLYKIGKYSIQLFKMMHEGQELEAWVQAKITKAADYIASVYHRVEYEMKSSDFGQILDNSDMYSESIKAGYHQKLMESRSETHMSLMETVYDRFKHPKYGTVEWINYENVHMIVIVTDNDLPKILTIGNNKEIADKWKKFKASANLNKTFEQLFMEKAKPSVGLSSKQRSNVVKKAKAGEDIGKKGKGFEKVEKTAKKSGAKDPKAATTASTWKQQTKPAK